MTDKIKIFYFDWMIPVTSPSFKNGALVVGCEGEIVDFGIKDDIDSKYLSVAVVKREYKQCAVMPALINAHTHLYYSAFEPRKAEEGFVPWVESLVESSIHKEPETIKTSMTREAAKMYDGGVGLIGNISSGGGLEMEALSGISLKGMHFIEVIGHNTNSLNVKLKDLAERNGLHNHNDFILSVSPHSLYSCSANVIREISAFCTDRGLPLMIHLAESLDEVEYLTHGTGKLREFLDRRGVIPTDWRPPSLTPIKYADKLGIVNGNLLAVHAVHVSDEEIDILSRSGATVVICPGSNRFLNVGTAPVDRFVDAGINVCIGTDSHASNIEMDVFEEMRIIKDNFNFLSAEDILKMVTINGAVALGFGEKYGSIEKGKKADLITVPVPRNIELGSLLTYALNNTHGRDVVRVAL